MKINVQRLKFVRGMQRQAHSGHVIAPLQVIDIQIKIMKVMTVQNEEHQ